jgi:hypothetical protein
MTMKFYQITRSFDAFTEGQVFPADLPAGEMDEWITSHRKVGLLRELTEEQVRSLGNAPQQSLAQLLRNGRANASTVEGADQA